MVPAVIGLLFDAIGAGVTLTDRALTYLENVWHLRSDPYPTVEGDAQPAGAGAAYASAAGTGGHPVRATSELITAAVCQLAWAWERDERPAVVAQLLPELRDRAAQFRAEGD